MKRIIQTTCLCILIMYTPLAKSQPGPELGVQTFTFHRFSFVETLEKARQLDLKYVEVYLGQQLGEGFGDLKMDYLMDKETMRQVLIRSKEHRVTIYACGVVACNTKEEWEQLFGFAGNMGIRLITCEPGSEHLDIVEQLADRYKIDIAIHNHPAPSLYRNPDMVMKALENRSKRMGVCADVGHWKREGLDPVECLKKCEGRIKSFHFKDIAGKTDEIAGQHDVVWGKGVCDVPGMIKEMKRQKFRGLISIEYEYNWLNSVPDILQCISFYNQQK